MRILVDNRLVDATPEQEAAIQADQAATVPVRRRVPKEVVRQRVKDAGKIDDAVQLIMGDADIFSRWTLPGKVDVFADDPDTVATLQTLGLDAAAILAE